MCVCESVCVSARLEDGERGRRRWARPNDVLSDARLLLFLDIGASNDWRRRVKLPSAGASWAGGRAVYKPRSFLVGGKSNSGE